jgi:hypothetical protein
MPTFSARGGATGHISALQSVAQIHLPAPGVEKVTLLVVSAPSGIMLAKFYFIPIFRHAIRATLRPK